MAAETLCCHHSTIEKNGISFMGLKGSKNEIENPNCTFVPIQNNVPFQKQCVRIIHKPHCGYCTLIAAILAGALLKRDCIISIRLTWLYKGLLIIIATIFNLHCNKDRYKCRYCVRFAKPTIQVS